MPSYTLTVNDRSQTVDVQPGTPLLWVLRDAIGLTGTKFGCGEGFCGACRVLIDGRLVKSCAAAIETIADRKITTIEGLMADRTHPIRKAWIEEETPQCGYCQPGQVMAAAALLARTSDPTDEEIDLAMGGALCRCGTYQRIRRAIHRAAKELVTR